MHLTSMSTAPASTSHVSSHRLVASAATPWHCVRPRRTPRLSVRPQPAAGLPWVNPGPCLHTQQSQAAVAAAAAAGHRSQHGSWQQGLLRSSLVAVPPGRGCKLRAPTPPHAAASTAASGGGGDDAAGSSALALPSSLSAAPEEPTYTLKDTTILVETAMLAAVSGLAYLLATLLKMEQSLGYFLPLPIVIAGMRSGPGAAWNTMLSTACLLLVLLGPLRAINYCLMHGMLAAALGSCWKLALPWSVSVPLGAALRMGGQLAYLLLSSVTLNENLFAVIVANVHGLLDRLSAALGTSGAPSTLTVQCMIFALLSVNALCYNFLLHVMYHIVLSVMGFKMGPLPGIVKKYLYAGLPQQAEQAVEGGGAAAPPVKA